jgi:hypothetical protein
VGWACSTHLGDRKSIVLWSVNLKRRGRLGNIGVNRRIILKKILMCEVLDWIYMTQYTNQYRTLIKTMLNLRSSIGGGEFLDQLSDYQLLGIKNL